MSLALQIPECTVKSWCFHSVPSGYHGSTWLCQGAFLFKRLEQKQDVSLFCLFVCLSLRENAKQHQDKHQVCVSFYASLQQMSFVRFVFVLVDFLLERTNF